MYGGLKVPVILNRMAAVFSTIKGGKLCYLS